jgi:hypothetical protein
MELWLELRDDAMMSIDRTVAAALAVARALRRNDGTVAAPLVAPDGLLLPKAVFPPFWAAYPTLCRGAVNGLPALRATCACGLLTELDRQGRDIIAAHDRRSKRWARCWTSCSSVLSSRHEDLRHCGLRPNAPRQRCRHCEWQGWFAKLLAERAFGRSA